MPGKKKSKQPKRSKLAATKKTGIVKHLKSGVPAKGNGGYAEDIGSSLGSWLGRKAGSLFKSITGIGDYRVQSNTLVAATDPPILSNTSAATRVQHREYIGDITGSTGFVVRQYAINPGMGDTFPWLQTVAGAFEEYRLHGIVFEFKSTSADALNSTNTALGTVIMATEYNVLHGAFTSKREMENYVYSTSSPPSVSAMHPVECARDVSVLSNLYVRASPPSTSTDLRFSDLGNFQLATFGMQAAAVIGELWCTYDVELIKPKLPDAFNATFPTHYIYDAVAYPGPSGAGAPVIASALYGPTGNSSFTLRGLGSACVTLDLNTMTFKYSGRYLVLWRYSGSVSGVSGFANAFVASSGVTVVNSFATNASTLTFQEVAPQNGASGCTTVMYALTVDVQQITTTLPTLTTNGSISGPTTITSADIHIIPLPSGFSSEEKESLETLVHRLQEQMRILRDGEDEKWVDPSSVVPVVTSTTTPVPARRGYWPLSPAAPSAA